MARLQLPLATLTGASLCFLLVAVPRWTAQKVEARRQQLLLSIVAATPLDYLPPCPAGDDLDRFLETPRDSSARLWQPVCRETELSTDTVVVVHKSRSGYATCREDVGQSSVADCVLEETLAFLADASRAKTRARTKLPDRQGRQVIWVTSAELPWDQALVRQHRLWLAGFLCLAPFLWIMAASARRARRTLAEQRSRSRETTLSPPRESEFLLLLILPLYSRDLPDDYREEYASRMAEHGRPGADRWYRRHVWHSLPALVRMRIHQLVKSPIRKIS